MRTAVDAVGTTKYTYTAGNQVRTEVPPSTLSTGTITNTYVNRLRTLMTLQQRTGWPQWTNAFAYDAAARLTNVTSPAGVFSYIPGAANPASWLTKKLLLPNTGYITNTFDSVARLTGTYLDTSANAVLDSALYGYNQANQRTAFTNAAGTYVQYSYDPIGQLKVANSSVSTENRGYFYDSAWNLNRLTNNGTASTFSVDVKNQLTADPNNVTDDYDANGNLIQRTGSTAIQTYGYDDENRLTNVVLGTTFNSVFAYDGLSRLRSRTDYWWTGTNWYPNGGAGYIFDGNRMIQERNAAGTPVVSYTRGIDLLAAPEQSGGGSGSLEGAGGIGGLLARSSGYSLGNWTTHHFYHADGNGNITYLVDSSQALGASYRYDPFGNTLSSSGPIATTNLYRFSSQLIDLNTGMYGYLYRFYDPSLQRWINRDPLGSVGTVGSLYGTFSVLRQPRPLNPQRILPLERLVGSNPYSFVYNDPVNLCDAAGLWTFGIGITVNFQIGPININFSGGFVADGQGNVGTFGTGGGGLGAGAHASGGLSFTGSNAQTICDLSGPFWNISAGAGEGIDGSIEGFTGPSDHGPVTGGGFTVGAGLGVGGAVGKSYTLITPIGKL